MRTRASRLLQFLAMVLAGTGWATSAPAQAQKSAQSDCTREAQRRGYQVLSTRNYQYLRYGWSMDIEVRDARGRVQSGTCFVESKTGDVSLYGFGWGGSSGGGSDYEFSCASSDEHYRECQLPVDGRARLVKQRSDAPCIEGRSWGQRGDRVWVDRGCRARFTVEPRGGGWGGGQGQQRAQAACRSEAQNHGMNVQDIGSAEWNQGGRYWAATVRGTYQGRRTTAGCRWYPDRQRTEMNLGNGWISGGSGWSGGGGNASQAERACLNEAQRQGYSVIKHESPYPTQSGYGMYLKVKRAGSPAVEGYCRYLRNGGRVQLEVFGPGRSAKGDPEVR
jgi:hypothetical protein